MKKAFEIINQMQASGIIGKYAIGGAVGATFYLEPVATIDIDIFVSFPAATAQGPMSKTVDLQKLSGILQQRGLVT